MRSVDRTPVVIVVFVVAASAALLPRVFDTHFVSPRTPSAHAAVVLHGVAPPRLSASPVPSIGLPSPTCNSADRVRKPPRRLRRVIGIGTCCCCCRLCRCRCRCRCGGETMSSFGSSEVFDFNDTSHLLPGEASSNCDQVSAVERRCWLVKGLPLVSLGLSYSLSTGVGRPPQRRLQRHKKVRPTAGPRFCRSPGSHEGALHAMKCRTKQIKHLSHYRSLRESHRRTLQLEPRAACDSDAARRPRRHPAPPHPTLFALSFAALGHMNKIN